MTASTAATIDRFCNLLVDGAMRAFADLVADRGLRLTGAQIDAAVVELRANIDRQYDALVATGRDVTDLGADACRMWLNAACQQAAADSLRAVL